MTTFKRYATFIALFILSVGLGLTYRDCQERGAANDSIVCAMCMLMLGAMLLDRLHGACFQGNKRCL